MPVVMDDVVACGVLQDRIAHRPCVECPPPRQEHAQLAFLVQPLVTANSRREAAGTGLLPQLIHWVFCIAQNVDVMSARMQFAR